MIFVFKHKTAYEMRISDWSPDVCSSYLLTREAGGWLITAHDRTFRARALVYAAGPFVLDLLHDAHQPPERRSEARRVGNESVSSCRSRWSPNHYTTTHALYKAGTTQYAKVHSISRFHIIC